MDEKKQIEEMAFNLIMATSPLGVKDLTKQFDYNTVATDLYKLYGWRKQSEWISVDERLPESEKMVIGYTPCDGFLFIGFYRKVGPEGYRRSYWNIITAMRSTRKITKKVTHWMPLPEPPKKGGAE